MEGLQGSGNAVDFFVEEEYGVIRGEVAETGYRGEERLAVYNPESDKALISRVFMISSLKEDEIIEVLDEAYSPSDIQVVDHRKVAESSVTDLVEEHLSYDEHTAVEVQDSGVSVDIEAKLETLSWMGQNPKEMNEDDYPTSTNTKQERCT